MNCEAPANTITLIATISTGEMPAFRAASPEHEPEADRRTPRSRGRRAASCRRAWRRSGARLRWRRHGCRRVSAGRSSRRSRRRRRRRRASRRVARGVEQARALRGRALPDPPAIVVIERRGLGLELVGQALAVRHQRGDAGRAVRLGLARVRVVLADVRGHGPSPFDAMPAAGRCERGCHRPAEDSKRSACGREPRAARVGRRGERPARRRPAVDELDRVLVAQAPSNGDAPDAGGRARSAPASTPVLQVAVGEDRDRRRERAVGLGHDPRRPDRPAIPAPPSTSADTSATWIWGWMSPPIDPATTHGRRSPSRNSIPGRSVWAGRLPGSRTLGLAGSSENDAPRFWKWTPVSGSSTPLPNPAAFDWMRLTALPSASTTPSQIVPPTSIRTGAGAGSARARVDGRGDGRGPLRAEQVRDRDVAERRVGEVPSRSARTRFATSSWRWIQRGVGPAARRRTARRRAARTGRGR